MKRKLTRAGAVGALLWGLALPACKKEECVQSERCRLVPDPGPCFAAMPRYYYNKEEKRCKEFTWGGCQGVVPFETLEACKACECND
ncbi:MAG: proteinase inhibitor I4 serpin [Cytophagales bacterium]|nr:proteinase inhibitor I4 serpin [Cytophagales bacterium]